MLSFYQALTKIASPAFNWSLQRRQAAGKESIDRIDERRGIASIERPEGTLIWIHAASVGESQSALILVSRLLEQHTDLSILITSGTVTSADMLAKKMPEHCYHQFVPMDRIDWIERFISHWRPDAAIWVESELWPNMLTAIKERFIPAILVNGRLSKKSAKRWLAFPKMAATLLNSFECILAQTEDDKDAFEKLGHTNVSVTGNLKYSAEPLPFDEKELAAFKTNVVLRPPWLYASTHQGEEELACETHLKLAEDFPDLLTIIVPRHPERRGQITEICRKYNLSYRLRSQDKAIPDHDTQVFIVDTIGELGLFYSLVPLAVIGRSFSDDGGGGHNPIEAAQLGAGVLTGPNVQYQQEIFDEMTGTHSALMLDDKSALAPALKNLLTQPEMLQKMQTNARYFIRSKQDILTRVEASVTPLVQKVIKA